MPEPRHRSSGPVRAQAGTDDAAIQWVHQQSSLGALADLDYGITLLRALQSRVLTAPLVRLYRPSPTVAFGQRDVRLPGFERARQASLAHGFTPVVRRAGGRAAAYHRGSLVVDHLQRDADAVHGFRDRFAGFGELFAEVFRAAGVPAAVGEIPGEYCAGEYSVHAQRQRVPGAGGAVEARGDIERGPVKLVGTAQRVVKGAWLFSSSLVVEDPEPIRAVLVDVYAALGLDWDPSTAGAATEAQVDVTVECIADGLRASYGTVVDRPWEDLLASVPAG
ncbi:biotin/lipoate A/B protein ligase family protein [Citricoccus sp. GCM10030269]|uniref:lipoate--protein ligase family protein n=1 Tax=Citricoccus sp. GCM10030269 TaxID=3273388 RepID=UPI003622BF2D